MSIKRLVIGAVALVALLTMAAGAGAYSNNFDTDTAGWFDNGLNTITQEPSGSANLGYANGIPSASGSGHARLNRGECVLDGPPPPPGIGPSLNCSGPYTYWGDGNKYTWNGDYQTQVDIYLDAAYANDPANGDSPNGNLDLIDHPTDATIPGTRFDYVSAINRSTPDINGDAVHLRDFGFIVGTGQSGSTCEGWTVNAQTNSTRDSAFPDDGSKDPACITDTGWYTFKHSFSDENGFLKVVMEIIPVGTSVASADWTITGIDASGTFGCNRYGWFSDQEIFGLPIDNASITGGCAGASIAEGQILPTGTTCQAYDAGTDDLDTVQYTLTKGDNPKINSVAPGVFFYYGTITGNEGDEFTITQWDDGSTPFIPVQHGQVILYDEDCNVVKWNPDSDDNGVVTGTLPSTGTFIISVKYNASALKGEANPGTVTYTIDDATVDLDLKPKA